MVLLDENFDATEIYEAERPPWRAPYFFPVSPTSKRWFFTSFWWAGSGNSNGTSSPPTGSPLTAEHSQFPPSTRVTRTAP